MSCNYKVEFKQINATIAALDLIYWEKPKTSEVVEHDLHAALVELKPHATSDVLVTGWHIDGHHEETLELPDGSRNILYKKESGSVVTMKEHSGVVESVMDTPDYLMKIETARTLEGITPEKHWFSAEILFKRVMPASEVYELMFDAVDLYRGSRKRISAYAYSGDPINRITWEQIKDSDGGYIFFEYEPCQNQYCRKGEVLKTFKD